ncbi:MAG: hypothetical protein IH877_01050 [Gemmatimonadetes bacterium]|nr:hypothetical protein [Gemmatimonadota bacterium]
MTALRRRLVVTLGWLLMPIAAWATAFFVSWIAALVGAGQESALVGFYLTVGGAVLGGVTGAVLWIYALRKMTRGSGATEESATGLATHDAQSEDFDTRVS